MPEEITQEFSDWTSYDNWLIDNNDKYSVTNLNEVNGRIVAVYFAKVTEADGEKAPNEEEITG